MIQNFNDFLNESETTVSIERALDATVLSCLGRLDIRGGNSNTDDEWGDFDSLFSNEDGPDLFIATDWEPKDPFYDDVDFISKLYRANDKYDKLIEDRFAQYGLEIETLQPDETILHIAGLAQDKIHGDRHLSVSTKNIVKHFYYHQKKWEKELKEKLKTYLTAKKFGI